MEGHCTRNNAWGLNHVRSWQRLALLVVAALALSTVACARWNVVRQATPNPFVGATTFYLEPIDYSVMAGPEREGAKAAEWDKVKERVNQTYLATIQKEADGFQFVKEPNADVVVIRTRVTAMDGGITMGLTSTSARIEMTVELVKGDQALDEIELAAEANQREGVSIGGIPTSGYTAGSRLNQASEKLGDAVAAYVAERTSEP